MSISYMRICLTPPPPHQKMKPCKALWGRGGGGALTACVLFPLSSALNFLRLGQPLGVSQTWDSEQASTRVYTPGVHTCVRTPCAHTCVYTVCTGVVRRDSTPCDNGVILSRCRCYYQKIVQIDHMYIHSWVFVLSLSCTELQKSDYLQQMLKKKQQQMFLFNKKYLHNAQCALLEAKAYQLMI